MEEKMREIGHALQIKDKTRLCQTGNMALKFNKILAVLGSSFIAMAAVRWLWFFRFLFCYWC